MWFDAHEPNLAGISSQYNRSTSDNTRMQPATQVSISIIETQTKSKKSLESM